MASAGAVVVRGGSSVPRVLSKLSVLGVSGVTTVGVSSGICGVITVGVGSGGSGVATVGVDRGVCGVVTVMTVCNGTLFMSCVGYV